MVVALVKKDLKKLLDKNALVMAIMVLVFTLLSYFLEETQAASAWMDLGKVEGFLLVYLIIFIELAKTTLVEDKETRKIEFLLANGLTRRDLIKKYLVSLVLGTFLILAPSLFMSLVKIKMTFFLGVNLQVSSLLISGLVVLMILYTVNMNKINGLQIRLLVLMLGTLGLSFFLYQRTSMVELYLLSKLFILGALVVFLGRKTSKERIVVSYY